LSLLNLTIASPILGREPFDYDDFIFELKMMVRFRELAYVRTEHQAKNLERHRR
jgi:hypothetical protein